MKKGVIISIITVVVLAAVAAALYFFVFRKTLRDQIVMPYIAHQKPRIDPHLPAADAMSDRLDEVLFDGVFNVSANPSGITYEDGLGAYVGIDGNNVVTIKLAPQKKWHSSYAIAMEKKKLAVSEREAMLFTAADLKFTLQRIAALGSLSPDFVLVGQAVENFDFAGPDENGDIKFQFKGDRIWSEADIKEVLSFKVVPANAGMEAAQYLNGTGPYMIAGQQEDQIYFYKSPFGGANISYTILRPFIDNSTYATELKNRNINVLLGTPFGSLAPILSDSTDFFCKSNISTCFFALLYNVQRLSLQQRTELRKLIYNRAIMDRFFMIGTPQQRRIIDYKGNTNNYEDYLNYSIFPSSSYYVEDSIVMPLKVKGEADPALLPDSIIVQTCLNFGYREELADLVGIMNDPALFGNKFKVTAVQNEELVKGNYDAILVPVSGYRSTFLFDLYDIFLREPDFAGHKINLLTTTDSKGKTVADERSFQADKNFFRLDLSVDSPEKENIGKLLSYVYGFMATHEIGDKQAYAQFLDQLEQEMALGSWLFSLPSLSYFSTQFDDASIDLYGVASQLSTIEKWKERPVKRSIF